MQYTTTISQKGQIVVPKAIRDRLQLHSSDRLNITLENNAVVARPVTSTDEVFGMFAAKKPISKKEIKDTYKKYIEKKFRQA